MYQKTKLSKLFAFFFLFVFVFGFSAVSSNKTVRKEIGIQLYSVREAMKTDVAGTIEKLGAMGYKTVETAGYSDGKLYGMEPTAFKALVEKNGMKVISAHCGGPVPSKENWDEAMAWWDKCIDANKAAGVKYIVQPSMNKMAYESLAGLKMYCDLFNAVGEKCAAKGIQFGYHNHAKEFQELEGQIIYDFMLKNTDPKKVFFQLDLYWIAEGGKNAVDYFNAYPGRFTLYHVKDEKELGESGKMNFEPAFKMAKKAGMKHYIVEVERYNFDPIVSVQKSIEFLMNQKYVK
ncbi:MAG: TIM barrel protein [Prolixibacteraceae bacterium]|jgi:sugar phosphate isomerase/epimerase|nr:TIM barrel protein [Prolixibacteraceae bacterium]